MESKVKRKRLFLLILVLAGANQNDIHVPPFISSSVDTDIRKSKVPGT